MSREQYRPDDMAKFVYKNSRRTEAGKRPDAAVQIKIIDDYLAGRGVEWLARNYPVDLGFIRETIEYLQEEDEQDDEEPDELVCIECQSRSTVVKKVKNGWKDVTFDANYCPFCGSVIEDISDG